MTSAWWRRRPPDGPAEHFAKHPGLLDEVLAGLLRTYQLPAAEAEELEAHLRRRIAENDFAILRDRGEASFLTFLVVTVVFLASDRHEEVWARWREDAAAAGHAEVVATLESLVYDQGLSFDDALRVAGVRDGVERRAELEGLWARRPWGGVRPPRRAGHA